MAAILSTLPSEIPIQLQGVFVHPDHFAAFSDEVSSPCSSTDSSSILSYGTDDDEHADYDMEYRDDRSAMQHLDNDYFAPRPKSSSSSFYTGSSDSTDSSIGGDSFSSLDDEEEDVATTPTPGSNYEAPCFRSSSYGETYPNLVSPPVFPASFAFNTFTASPASSRPSSRPASPSRRAHPYAKSSSAMMRSVSSPVETNRQVEARKSAMLAFTASMDERASMIRSKSTPNAVPTPGGVQMSRSAASSRAPTAPFLTPFEDNWGSALPPREAAPSTLLPFPYNLASPPSRFRFNRANSYAGVENHYEAPRADRHGSVPSISVSSPACASASPSTSSGMARTGSARRSSVLRPLTPIVSQPPASQDGVCNALESFTFSPSPSSPPQMVRARLNRGLSF
ncbi:hypothetical protein JCM11491_002733 [Sporobolomyces phaffii]